MTRQGLILLVVLILAIMFVPVLLADGLERFFAGIGVIFGRWTS